MAQESCNLDKDDAELLKPPSSASSTSAAPPQPAAAGSPAIFLKSSSQDQHHQLQQQQPRTDSPKKPDTSTNSLSVSGLTRKRKLESTPSPLPPEADAASAFECVGKAQKVESTADAPAAARATAVNRCSCCQKRVGLTGFRCRCGDLFCAQHRYSDAHGCSFDYKAAGRAEISKANPVVRAPKIIKI